MSLVESIRSCMNRAMASALIMADAVDRVTGAQVNDRTIIRIDASPSATRPDCTRYRHRRVPDLSERLGPEWPGKAQWHDPVKEPAIARCLGCADRPGAMQRHGVVPHQEIA